MLGPFDVLLVIVVSLQVTVLAYVSQPRHKALALTLPFPFTVLTLSLAHPIGAPHLLGLPILFVYTHSVRLLHQRGLPIIPAIGIGGLLYILLASLGSRLVPDTPAVFWSSCLLLVAGALAAYLGLPHRSENPHRTPLPLWQKLPIVISLVLILVQLKSTLAGFAALFPLVGTLGAYEARHSLWTMGRQIPVLILVMVPMVATAHLLQERWGLAWGLVGGWLALGAVLGPLTWHQWSQSTR